MDKKAVFDFDKTLIKVNTFPIWIVFVLMYSIVKFDFKVEILELLWKRKLTKSISHNQFKEALLNVKLDQSYHYIFAKFISNFKNEKCRKELIILQKQNYKIAISSAAPAHYLKATINYLFPNHQFIIIGANSKENKFSGNYKEEKLHNLIQFGFINFNEKIDYLFTDSYDDIALARQTNKLVLVSPDKGSIKLYKSNYNNDIVII
ncbi:HAD family hydrolase [Faecalibacter bovis]|uniref:Haloacid dehalogenase-like hydrolase n=1 Tax=Faecalibacter bovis TaxID=2898187 RepID=A0ABX7XE64_9FLAO|nr:HAD family hydrolase [Faecalibacter bovis]MBS7333221.1 haloacid dehalogenase-like hydrolase [Weeksellaceae bacterium]QTV06150.1 haloacid dehalogenase-like hydrolase [Faecalibacter bovis]